MRGGIREKRPGVWEIRYEAGRDPLTGTRRQVSRSFRGTKREAERALNAVVADADRGVGRGSARRFEQLVSAWLEATERNLSPTTVHRYRILIRTRILPALGDRKVREIRADDLEVYYRALQDDAGLAVSTVRQIHAIIRGAFRYGVLKDWLPSSPAMYAKPPKGTPEPKPVPTPPMRSA